MHSLRQRRPHYLICDLGRDTTAPHHLEMKTYFGNLGTDVKTISLWHTEARSGKYHPSSPSRKSIWQHPASPSTNRLQWNEHCDIAEPTHVTRATIRTSIFLHPGLVKMSVESRKESLFVQYFEHIKPVEKSEVLVIPTKAYNLVLGLPWQETK